MACSFGYANCRYPPPRSNLEISSSLGLTLVFALAFVLAFALDLATEILVELSASPVLP